MGRGIPIVYYGTEQKFSGGSDPGCREPLWTNMDTSSELYTWLKNVISYRKKFKVWEHKQIDRWHDSELFMFSRGSVLVATSSTYNQVSHDVTYHPYSEG